MRILADENVATAVVSALRLGGQDVKWVAESARGSRDNLVLEMAVRENRLLLTHDKEFAAIAARSGVRGLQGVILLRLEGLSPEEVGGFVARTLAARTDWAGRFAIVKPKIIRMRSLIQ